MEWEIKDVFIEDDVKAIEDGLNAFNTGVADRNYKPLVIVIKDNNAIVAGARCASAWEWMHVRLLWVDETHRLSGLGAAILNRIEQEARSRGCVGVHLDTFEFQAPRFYSKLGYTVFGEIEDYPRGYKRFYLSKRLD